MEKVDVMPFLKLHREVMSQLWNRHMVGIKGTELFVAVEECTELDEIQKTKRADTPKPNRRSRKTLGGT